MLSFKNPDRSIGSKSGRIGIGSVKPMVIPANQMIGTVPSKFPLLLPLFARRNLPPTPPLPTQRPLVGTHAPEKLPFRTRNPTPLPSPHPVQLLENPLPPNDSLEPPKKVKICSHFCPSLLPYFFKLFFTSSHYYFFTSCLKLIVLI